MFIFHQKMAIYHLVSSPLTGSVLDSNVDDVLFILLNNISSKCFLPFTTSLVFQLRSTFALKEPQQQAIALL